MQKPAAKHYVYMCDGYRTCSVKSQAKEMTVLRSGSMHTDVTAAEAVTLLVYVCSGESSHWCSYPYCGRNLRCTSVCPIAFKTMGPINSLVIDFIITATVGKK